MKNLITFFPSTYKWFDSVRPVDPDVFDSVEDIDLVINFQLLQHVHKRTH